jgi:hypothetical protein
MSLFRVALVLSLGIAVMPSDEAQQKRLYQNAAAAAYWTATFCDRNGATCDTASSLWATFLRKAEFAGQLVYDVAQHYSAGGEGGAGVEPASLGSRALERSTDRGTLKPDDLRPEWRGAIVRQGA